MPFAMHSFRVMHLNDLVLNIVFVFHPHVPFPRFALYGMLVGMLFD
jgi:hypothetical protein